MWQSYGAVRDTLVEECQDAQSPNKVRNNPDIIYARYNTEVGKEAEAKFKEASEAYAVLSDPDKRSKYDQFGHAAFDGSAGGQAYDFNMDDIFGSMGDIFGDLFGGGRSRARSNGPMQGANLRASVRITFEEAAFGCEKELDITLKDECASCLLSM